MKLNKILPIASLVVTPIAATTIITSCSSPKKIITDIVADHLEGTGPTAVLMNKEPVKLHKNYAYTITFDLIKWVEDDNTPELGTFLWAIGVADSIVKETRYPIIVESVTIDDDEPLDFEPGGLSDLGPGEYIIFQAPAGGDAIVGYTTDLSNSNETIKIVLKFDDSLDGKTVNFAFSGAGT